MSDLIETITVALVAFFLGAILFGGCCIRTIQKEAVVAGVAEYYIDADHDRAFRWKTNAVPDQSRREKAGE